MANFLGYLAGGLLKGGGRGLENVAEHRIKEKEKEAEIIKQEQMAKFKQGLEDTSWEKRNEITTTRDDKIRAEDLDRKSKEKIESDKRYTAEIEATEQYRKDTLAQKKEQLKQNKQIAINQAKALLSENRFKAYTKRVDKAAEIEAKMIELQTVKANKVSEIGLVDPTIGTNKEPMTNDEAIADYQKMLNAYNKETRRLYPELSGANAEAKAEKTRLETKYKNLSENYGLSVNVIRNTLTKKWTDVDENMLVDDAFSPKNSDKYHKIIAMLQTENPELAKSIETKREAVEKSLNTPKPSKPKKNKAGIVNTPAEQAKTLKGKGMLVENDIDRAIIDKVEKMKANATKSDVEQAADVWMKGWGKLTKKEKISKLNQIKKEGRASKAVINLIEQRVNAE